MKCHFHVSNLTNDQVDFGNSQIDFANNEFNFSADQLGNIFSDANANILLDPCFIDYDMQFGNSFDNVGNVDMSLESSGNNEMPMADDVQSLTEQDLSSSTTIRRAP